MPNKNFEFNENYWNTFYQRFQKYTPSQFCVSVLTEIDPGTILVELGSGNGRDANYFASQGYITVAMDLSSEAIKNCRNYAQTNEIHHSTFCQGDLTDKDSIEKVVQLARTHTDGNNIAFYCRFVMHSLDDQQEEAFLAVLSDSMIMGETVYFEFRSKEDAELEKFYGGHFRRYVDTDQFLSRLERNCGLSIEYAITGRGMAKFREEDPFVSRIIAKK